MADLILEHEARLNAMDARITALEGGSSAGGGKMSRQEVANRWPDVEIDSDYKAYLDGQLGAPQVPSDEASQRAEFSRRMDARQG